MRNLEPLVTQLERDEFIKETGCKPCLYIYLEGKSIKSTEVYKLKYDDVCTMMSSMISDKSTLTQGSKIGVLKSEFRKDQWEEFAKKNSYKLTDLDKSDVVVITTPIDKDFGRSQPNFNSLGFYSNGDGSNFLYYHNFGNSTVDALPEIKNYEGRVLLSHNVRVLVNHHYTLNYRDSNDCYLYPEFVRTYNAFKNGTKRLIQESDLRSDILPSNIIDKDVYERLRQMFKSSDSENYIMGQAILNGCDVDKSIFWIRMLSLEFYNNKLINNRTKASKSFEVKSNINDIRNMDSMKFFTYLIKNELLTEFMWVMLTEEIKMYYKNISNNDFYNVEFKLKPKYESYVSTISKEISVPKPESIVDIL